MANLRARYKEQLGKNAPENHYGNNGEWLQKAIAKSVAEESLKRKRDEEPKSGYWQEKKIQYANPQTPEQEAFEAEAIKGKLAAQKSKDAGHAFGNISTGMKTVHAALTFAIRKRKENHQRDDMAPDKLTEAVFLQIQQGIADNEIEPGYDIEGALKYCLEKVNLHQHIIDLTSKCEEQQRLYRRKQAEIKHFQDIVRKARTMLDDADKGVPAMPEMTAAAAPRRSPLLQRCPSLPITASRDTLDKEVKF